MSSIAHLSLLEQAIFLFAAFVLLSSFSLLAQPRILSAIHVFAWQGALVAGVAALTGAHMGDSHLFLSAAITFGLKTLLIPWMLHRLVRQLEIERHVETLKQPGLIILAGAALTVFSYWVALPIAAIELAATRNIIAVSLAVVLLGMLMMVARTQAVVQVLGFMSVENGLFLAAVATTRGMPLVVELGIAFDVLVAMVLFGVFFFQIRSSIDSLDVDHLNRLAETTQAPEDNGP